MSSTNVPQAALDWLTSGDTGASSKSIWAHMTGAQQDRIWGASYPLDPADAGRCFRLLERVPEWKPRIGEMAKYGPEWAALVARWDEVRDSMEAEVGIDWRKGKRAPLAYSLMVSIELAARNASAA